MDERQRKDGYRDRRLRPPAEQPADVAGQPAGREFLRFVAWLVLFSSPFWVLGWAAGPEARLLGALPIAALQFVAPLGAAIVTTAGRSGRPGLGILLRRVALPGRLPPVPALMAALLIMPSIYLLVWLAQLVSGQRPPALELALGALPVVALVFLVTAWAEEVGWTAHALDPAVRLWGTARAALVIGLVWAALHVIPDIQAGHDAEWIAAQRIAAVAQRVIIVWIVLGLGGTLATAAIAHAMDNISWAVFTDSGATYDPILVLPGTLLVAALVLTRLRDIGPSGARHPVPLSRDLWRRRRPFTPL